MVNFENFNQERWPCAMNNANLPLAEMIMPKMEALYCSRLDTSSHAFRSVAVIDDAIDSHLTDSPELVFIRVPKCPVPVSYIVDFLTSGEADRAERRSLDAQRSEKPGEARAETFDTICKVFFGDIGYLRPIWKESLESWLFEVSRIADIFLPKRCKHVIVTATRGKTFNYPMIPHTSHTGRILVNFDAQDAVPTLFFRGFTEERERFIGETGQKFLQRIWNGNNWPEAQLSIGEVLNQYMTLLKNSGICFLAPKDHIVFFNARINLEAYDNRQQLLTHYSHAEPFPIGQPRATLIIDA